MKKNARKRKQIRHKTNGNCYYCDLPMMRRGLEREGAKREWMEKHGFEPGFIGERSFCRASKETIEHLTKKADGGRNNPDNLVLAHQFCNSHRGDHTPAEHKERMKAEIENPLSPLYIIANFYGRGE